ncbi:MAG: M50 family metallopeptidase [Solirubrobacterales bacterium]
MSFLLAFLAFCALIVLHEAGHFFAAKATGMRVEKFFLFFPPKLFSIKRGETEYGVGAIPLGGYVRITGMNPEEEIPPEVAPRAYYRQPVWKRIVVIGAGPAVNIAIAFLILFFLAFGVQESTDRIGQVEPDSPAAGRLMPGDRLIAVDGVRGSQDRLASRIATHRCEGQQTDGCLAKEPAKLTIERGGEVTTIEVRPRFDSVADRPRVGFAFDAKPLSPTAPEAAGLSIDFMWRVSTETVGVLSELYKAERREELSGVAGSYEVTRQAIDTSGRQALTIIALISLSLGIINLFPFLPLDGGHIFWSVIEKIRGRPVPYAVMERAGIIGFALVLGLFFIGLTNDIGRLTGEGFGVR